MDKLLKGHAAPADMDMACDRLAEPALPKPVDHAGVNLMVEGQSNIPAFGRRWIRLV